MLLARCRQSCWTRENGIMGEVCSGGRCRSLRLPITMWLALSLSVVAMFGAGCNGDPDGGAAVEAPKRADTGVKSPDPCGLLSPAAIDRLIGAARVDPSADGRTSTYCRWNNEADAPPRSKEGGILQVDVYVQRKQVVGGEIYGDAKARYKASQVGKPCVELRTAADQACWRRGDAQFSVYLRKGYVAVSFSCAFVNPESFRGERAENAAGMVVNEVLSHLHA